MKQIYQKYVAWIFAIALLASCGMIRDKFGRLPGGSTTVTLSLPAAQFETMAWPSVSGGLMAYVVGINGTPYATSVALNLAGGTTGSASVTVPNGTYRVYALAFEGPNNLEGINVACGASASYLLDGTPKDINLTVEGSSGTTCGYVGGSTFADSGYNTINTMAFPGIFVNACSGLTTIGCAAATTTYTTNASVKVELRAYKMNNGTFDITGMPSIVSPCYGGGPTFSTSAKVPPGSSAAGSTRFIATGIYLYAGTTTCAGLPSKIIAFPYGIANASSDTASLLNGSTLYINAP